MGTFGASQIIEFFKSEGIKPKIAIVGEPTGMVPLVGHKGGLEMITEIKGSNIQAKYVIVSCWLFCAIKQQF